jgi:hypothetical protein
MGNGIIKIWSNRGGMVLYIHVDYLYSWINMFGDYIRQGGGYRD